MTLLDLKSKFILKIKSADNRIEGLIHLNKGNDLIFTYKRIGDKNVNDSMYLADFIKNNDLSKFIEIEGELAE